MRAKLLVTMGWCVLLATVAARPALAQPGAPFGAAVKDPQVVKPKKASPAADGKTLKFTTCSEPYFVKNTFEPSAAESFAVLTSLEQFDNVFGVGMTMRSKRPTIDAQTFQSQTILAVVKRGPMCKYTVQSVTAKGDGLEVRYQAKTDPPGSATFAVPLILAVPKGEYAAVTFIENGKEVKVVKQDR